jgi:AraC-like DNA-binding protein
MRVLGRFAMVYLLNGAGWYGDASGQERRIGPGDVILVDPAMPHYYEPGTGEIWDELYVVFEGELFDAWKTAGVLDTSRPVRHVPPVEYWVGRLLPVLEAHSPPDPVRTSRFLAVLTEMLFAEAPAGAQEAPWIEVAERLLESNLEEDTDLETVASRVGMSYETFRKRFQEATGISPGRFRMNRRLEAARDLLMQTQMTGKQVAASVGFSDEFYFYRRFKLFAGVSPSGLRRARRSGGSATHDNEPSSNVE